MNKKAFTLVEISITSIIMGMLSMLVISQVMNMQKSNSVMEAFNNLQIIYDAQQRYWSKNSALYSDNGVYYYSGSTVEDLNQNLNINIIPISGETYSCYFSDLTKIDSFTCKALFKDGFTLLLFMWSGVDSKATRPRYCKKNTTDQWNASTDHDVLHYNNPCCIMPAGVTKRETDLCP